MKLAGNGKMNLNDVLSHLNNVYKLVAEIRNDVMLMQKDPDANHQEKIAGIQKKLDYIAQFSAGFSRQLGGAPSASLPKPEAASAAAGGGLNKLDAIRFVFQTNASLRNWYQSELGVTAQDFTDQNIHSSMADQIISDGITKNVIRKAGDNAFVPIKK